MELRKILELLSDADRLRIYKGKEPIFNGYKALLKGRDELILNNTVKALRFEPEIRHKDWKALGLIPPLTPEDTVNYSFSDLEIRLYYDIILEEQGN